MKKTLLTAIFIFSLVLNVAVAGTLVWHVWFQDRPPVPRDSGGSPPAPADFREMRTPWPSHWRAKMMENREKIMEKRREVLDLIAQNPDNVRAADMALEELASLKGQQERLAVERISTMMRAMPVEKRQAFLQFLKDRTCMGPGMGMGHRGFRNRGMHMRGPGVGQSE